MKLTIARGELSEALSVVARGLSSRSTLPILSGILVSAEDDGTVVLQTTDLEVSIKTRSVAAVDKAGQSVLPGRLLTDIVRSLPEAAVTIEVDGETAAITCGQAAFTVRTLKADDFPRFPEVEFEQKVDLGVGILSQAVSHVAKVVSRDETRPILTGVLMTVDGPTLKMVATDSYRLAVKEIVFEGAETEGIDVVVPGRALDEATRIAAGEKQISVGVSENQMVFEAGNTVFVTRRIEGAFPNYRQLIPKDPETRVTVPRDELMQAVKRVSLMAQHNTPLRLTVSAEDQTLSLSATTQDIGEASEDLMATVEGPDVEIAFNHVFLTDGIASAEGEAISIDIVSPLKPGVMTAEGDEGFLYLLMPVRLG